MENTRINVKVSLKSLSQNCINERLNIQWEEVKVSDKLVCMIKNIRKLLMKNASLLLIIFTKVVCVRSGKKPR